MVETPLSVDYMTSKDFHLDVCAHIDVIQNLLSDKTHWKAYRETIAYNRHLFAGRTVLNIGCGIGILSLFAAKAGAACVYAVDESNVSDYARRVVQANNYAHVIKVFKSRVQDLVLPVGQVDIILCDWFGYSLLYQSLCAEVIYARDKWLKKGGIIFPDMAKLYISALTDSRHKYEHIDWWYDVYGFTMKPLRELALAEPTHQQVHEKQILSTNYLVYSLNLNTATVKDLKFRSKYMLDILYDGTLDGVFTYFEAKFSKSHTPAYISSSPASYCTRWLQTVYFFDRPVNVKKGAVYCGGFEMYPVTEGRLNNIEVGLEMLSGDTELGFHLELDMLWHLKPASLADEPIPVVDMNQVNKEQQQKSEKIIEAEIIDGTFIIGTEKHEEKEKWLVDIAENENEIEEQKEKEVEITAITKDIKNETIIIKKEETAVDYVEKICAIQPNTTFLKDIGSVEHEEMVVIKPEFKNLNNVTVNSNKNIKRYQKKNDFNHNNNYHKNNKNNNNTNKISNNNYKKHKHYYKNNKQGNNFKKDNSNNINNNNNHDHNNDSNNNYNGNKNNNNSIMGKEENVYHTYRKKKWINYKIKDEV